MVTTKIMKLATLDQMIDCAAEYDVEHGYARRFVERMLELANDTSDALVWYRINAVASHLNVIDLAQSRPRPREIGRRRDGQRRSIR
jgi:hypothetical protein